MGNFHSVTGQKKENIRLKQFRVLVYLSLTFIVVYGACNLITSNRTDVGVLFFEWERHIPFLPLFIIPYMSIDLFFVGAPFLCSNREELKGFSTRVTVGILIAGIFFLLIPLQFAFPRPHIDHWLAPVFKLLYGFDQPHNLFPSLHIILRTLLAHKYSQKTKGVLNVVLHVWFVLIGLSTLFTYQHHIADIVAGFIVAILLFYIFPDKQFPRVLIKNPRVGNYYFLAAAFFILPVMFFQPWGLFFLWPALAFSIVGYAYFYSGSGITRKMEGKVAFSAKLLLMPWLLGQQLSKFYYQKQCNDWDEIVKGVWMGRVLNDKEAQQAVDKGVTAVLDLTAEFSEAEPFLNQRYLNLQILDLTAPTLDQIHRGVDFIAENQAKGNVYVHCKIGYSRSAALIAAYLLYTGSAGSVQESVRIIKSVRKSVVIRPEIWKILEKYLKTLK